MFLFYFLMVVILFDPQKSLFLRQKSPFLRQMSLFLRQKSLFLRQMSLFLRFLLFLYISWPSAEDQFKPKWAGEWNDQHRDQLCNRRDEFAAKGTLHSEGAPGILEAPSSADANCGRLE
jgi:hypothetical protein